MLGLDKRSSVPLYAQLKVWLTDKIESGEYKPGDKIPTELSLCDSLGLSRPTVRQAIAEMVAEGHLYIVKGKGTFVSEEPERIELKDYQTSLFSLTRSSNYDKHFFIDYHRILRPSQEQQTLFTINNPLLSEGLVKAVYLLSENEKNYAYITSYLPLVLYPHAIENFQKREKLQAETKDVDARVKEEKRQIILRAVQNDEARYLDIAKGSTILQETGFLYNEQSQIVEVLQIVFKPDAVRLITRKEETIY